MLGGPKLWPAPWGGGSGCCGSRNSGSQGHSTTRVILHWQEWSGLKQFEEALFEGKNTVILLLQVLQMALCDLVDSKEAMTQGLLELKWVHRTLVSAHRSQIPESSALAALLGAWGGFQDTAGGNWAERPTGTSLDSSKSLPLRSCVSPNPTGVLAMPAPLTG